MAQTYLFDDLVVDPQSFRVIKAGRPVALEPKALNVLVFLIENRRRLVEKKELIDAVWGDAFVTENVLSRAIAQLRKALADDAKESRYIETVPTRGYRFIAAVEIGSNQISAAQAGAPKSGVPVGVTAHRARTFGRFSIALAALIVGAGLMVGGVIIYRWRMAPEHLQIAASTQITTSSGLSMHPTFSPDGTSMAYSADGGNGFEIFVRQLAPGGREVQITSDGGQNMQPAWSPDGKTIAYYSQAHGGIWLVPALGGTTRRLIGFGSHPAWSRDGQWIAFQSAPLNDLGANSSSVFPPSTIWKIRSDGNEAKQVTRAGVPEGGHGAPSWSPDGTHIVFVSVAYGESSVWATGLGGGKPLRLTPQAIGYFDPIYSPDGKSVLYGAIAETLNNYGLFQIRVDPRDSAPLEKPVQLMNSGGVRIKNLAYSSDGKKLLYSGVALTGSLMSLSLSASGEPAGEPAPLTKDVGCRPLHPVFSPDGSRIAFVFCSSRAGVFGQIWLMNRDGSARQQLTFNAAGSGLPRWYPDGRHILFASDFAPGTDVGLGKLFSLDTETRQQTLVAEMHQDTEQYSLSPDGTQLVFGSTVGGILNLWLMDMATGKATQLTFDKELLGFPFWSPDGKYIAAQMQRGRETSIVILPSSGGEATQLTFDPGQHWPGGWAPDGVRVLFVKRELNGIWNVWWVSRSTKVQKQLTHYAKLNAYVRYPAFSPRGNQIVYEYTESTGNIWMLEFR